jgi:predicted CXXCH cytochrome family protein
MDLRAILMALILTLSLPATSSSSEPTCGDCHPDKLENAVVHPAVLMGCDSCHVGTHMGEQPAPKLLSEAPGLCFNCHAPDGFQKQVQHYPAASGMCLFCHTPHAGAHDRLLTAEVNVLCTSCHKKQSDGGHVMQSVGLPDKHPLQHRPDPSRPGQELSCVSCHDPHASDRERLFRGTTATGPGICQLCHRKMAILP